VELKPKVIDEELKVMGDVVVGENEKKLPGECWEIANLILLQPTQS
jgi:hypothetical protein